MMIRAAVCDDEKESRDYIVLLIQKQPFCCETVEYASAGECLADKRKIDLLFLDIALHPSGTGLDGMTLARRLRERENGQGPVIVFVTGYDKYVFDAFDVEAFQYLVKPVDEEKFARVFARAAARITAEESAPEQENQRDSGRLVLKSAGIVRSLPFRSIYYIESSNHKVMVHLKDGVFTCYARIRDLEAELRDVFFRIHKGYLINLSYVERYSRTEAVMADGEKLPVSKYKYREFVKAYLCFLKEGADL